MGEETYRCALCEKKLRAGANIFGLGVKLKSWLEYPGGIGRATLVQLPVQGRMIECLATADGSRAKLEGWDLVFMLCSEECGAGLREILEGTDMFEEIM